mgnify:CR=1 FL=1
MPTYDYQCSSCSSVQDVFHAISANPEIKCNKCGAMCVKIFTASQNFILKGGDWPSQDLKMKRQMTEKNTKMKGKMTDREHAGDAVRNLGELKKKNNLNN